MGAPASPPNIKGALASLSSLWQRHWTFLKFRWKEAKTAPAGGGLPAHRTTFCAGAQGSRTGGRALSPNYLLPLSPSFFRGEGDSISKVLSGPTLWVPMEGSDLLILGKDGRWCRRT